MMLNLPVPARRAQRGFTLVELMITVAIVGILAAVAYPAYNASVRKSRRADAKTALVDLAQREERYMSTGNVYSETATDVGYPAASSFPMQVMSGGKSFYTLSVKVGNPATTFTATAAPTGDQVKDQCGSFTLNEKGVQGVTGGSASAADCW